MKKRRPNRASRLVPWRITTVLLLFALCQVALANPPRVSLVEGTALYESADDVEITELTVNLPLLTGDRIYGVDNARIEIQQGLGNVVRVAGNTDLKWLGTDTVLRIELTAGNLILRVTDSESHKIFTPFASVRLTTPGLYRVSVDLEGRLLLTVREGTAQVANRLRVREVSAGEQIEVDQAQSGLTQVSLALPLDEFELWSENRDQIFQRAASADYLDPSYTAGVVELDHYGEWEQVNDYGQVWFPQVSVDFTPYQVGRWAHYPRWGWTWISYEPWGWLPYHYGQWVYYQPYSRWCWVPGRSRWSGALVDFYYGGGYVGWAPRGHRGWGGLRRYGSGFGLAIGTPGFSFVLQTDFGRHRVDRRLRRNAANNVRVFREGLPRNIQSPRNPRTNNVVTVGRDRNRGNQSLGNRNRGVVVNEAQRRGGVSSGSSNTRNGLQSWRDRDRNGQPTVRQGDSAAASPSSPGWTTRQRQGNRGTQTVQPGQPSRSRQNQEGVQSRTPSRSQSSTPRVSRSRSGNGPRVTQSPSRPSVTRTPSRPPATSARPSSPQRRPTASGQPSRNRDQQNIRSRTPSRSRSSTPTVSRSRSRSAPRVTRSPSRASTPRSPSRSSVTRAPSRPSVTSSRSTAPRRRPTTSGQRPTRKP